MNNIKQKLFSLSAKEVIMAMVNGLRKPHTCIDMGTFGTNYGGVCFGCAATNALIEATGIPVEEAMDLCNSFAELDCFEAAVNCLRKGDITCFNLLWDHCKIVNPNKLVLPFLQNNYTQERLDVYEQLANDQPDNVHC